MRRDELDDTMTAIGEEPTLRPSSSDTSEVESAVAGGLVAHPAPGTTIGRYSVLSLLGAGGVGVVLKAFDPDLDRAVAVKMVRGDAVDAAHDRMAREAQAAARISHPNVVNVFDVGTFGGRVFIAMEYVPGRDLRSWIESEGPDLAATLDVFRQAGEGLLAAHREGLVHRDFKPSNVILGRDGRARVVDFGLARALEPREEGYERHPAPGDGALLAATNTGTVLGTPRYMAPEQHTGGALDARADQFSFCAALFEAVYGVPAFHGDTYDQLRANVLAGTRRAAPANTQVPGWLDRLIARGLSVDPEHRFPDMAGLLEALSKRGPEARFEGVWDETVAKALRGKFLATGRPHAARTFDIVRGHLDRYVARWRAAQTDVFEATHVRGEQSSALLDARMTWLNSRVDELRALTSLYVDEADGEMVDAAAYAAGRLSAPEDVMRHVVEGGARPAPPPEVARLRRRLNRATALERAGKYPAALAEVREVRAAPSTNDRQVQAEALILEGILLDHTADFEAATTSFISATHEAAATEDDVSLALAWTKLVETLGHHRGRHDAGEAFGHAAAAAITRAGSDNALLGELENNLGSLDCARGRLDDALAHHRRGLELRRASRYPRNAQIAWSLNNIATVLSLQGKFGESLEVHRECFDLREEALGPEHPDVGVSWLNIGCVHGWRKDFERQRECHERAVAIFSAALGDDNFKTGMAVHNLGECFAGLGQPAKALAMQREALRVFEKNLGGEHPNLAYPLTSIGQCLIEQGDPAAALAPLERALALRENEHGGAMERGHTLFAMARAHWDLGAHERGRDVAAKAVAAYESAGGPAADAADSVRSWLATRPGA